jgi:hypothetical protein
LVENNVIHNYACLVHTYRPGINLGRVGQIVRHKIISDAPHFPTSFSGNNHLIELNHIHNICSESNNASAVYARRSWTSSGMVNHQGLERFFHHALSAKHSCEKHRGIHGIT